MTTLRAQQQVTFEAPGPGFWELNAVHTSRPFTRFMADILPAPAAEGFRGMCRRYGLLIDQLEHQFVNGFLYRAVRPVDPAEVPARLEAAERVFDRKLW